jgi:hypothetical protein
VGTAVKLQEPQTWPGMSGADAYQVASPTGEEFARKAGGFDRGRQSDNISIASTRTADGFERDMQVWHISPKP